MGTYYINPNGLDQGSLIKALKDIETTFGGTNSTDSITIQTTFDAVKPEKGMSVAKSVITAGSIWESAVSVAVNSGYAIGYNNSYGNSAAKSYATSAYTAQSTASSAASAAYPSIALSYLTSSPLVQGSVMNSVVTAGSILASGISVAIQSGHTAGLILPISRLQSNITANGTEDKSVALSYHTSGVITPAAVMDSVIAAGSNLHSAVSVAVASGHTSTFVNIISVIASRLSAHSI